MTSYSSEMHAILTIILVWFSAAILPVFSQEILAPERTQNMQNDTLLQALEQALFPTEVQWVRIRDYPNCWQYEMKIDTNRLVRLPQPDHREVGALLRQIAFTRNYRYFEPLMTMYLRHQDYFKKEWEEVHKEPNNSGCDVLKYPMSIMLNMENALRALEFAHRQISRKELWAYYVRQRDLGLRIWKHIGSWNDNTQSYEFYSEYFRELRRIGGWFAYESFVQPYSPFIDMIEDKIVEECYAYDPMNIKGSSKDSIKYRKLYYHNVNQGSMTELYSPKYEACIMNRFEDFIKTDNASTVGALFQYAQRNPHISESYVHFMMDQLFYHEKFSDWSYEDKENWYKFLIDHHTRPYLKSYLLEKVESKRMYDRALGLALLVQFPEEDVMDLFLSRARSRYATEQELEVLYKNLKRINQRKYFSESRHDEVRRQLKRMVRNYEKNEK